jgi:hypothetical protein
LPAVSDGTFSRFQPCNFVSGIKIKTRKPAVALSGSSVFNISEECINNKNLLPFSEMVIQANSGHRGKP